MNNNHPPWPTLKHDLVLYILIAFAPESLLRSYIGRSKLTLKNGTNPLLYTVQFHGVEHARILLASGVTLNRRGWTTGPDPEQVLPLEFAVNHSSYPLVDLFLTEGSPVPHELFTSTLETFNQRIFAPVVGRLLQSDQFVEWADEIRDKGLLLRVLDPTRYPERSLYGGLSDQGIDVVQRRLVQIGCDPSTRFDETSLRNAASAGLVFVVERMLASNTPMPPNIILHASRSKSSNAAIIRLFIGRGCDVNVVSPTGGTALHFLLAPKYEIPEDECLKSVQALVEAGCNPCSRDLVDDTPLHRAVSLGYLSVIKYLLSQHVSLPFDVLLLQPPPCNIYLEETRSPTASMIHFLIREGADVHAISANGNTPLHLLLAYPVEVSEELLQCAKILIDAGCNPCIPNALGETPFDVAVKVGHLAIVEYFFSLNFLPSPNILLSVSGSDSWNATPMIKFLINKGINIHVTDHNGDNALHLSMNAYSDTDCLQRIKMLVNAGCDTRACNGAGKTLFHIAARRRYIPVMEYLISVGTSVPSDIFLAVFYYDQWAYNQRSCYPVIRFLLEIGGDVQTTTKDRRSLLHLAATLDREHDALEVAKLLVSAGCSPHVLDSAYETPLHAATQYGYVSVINYFLSLDIPLPPDILLAASKGHVEKANLIRLLIEKGADPHVVTTSGDSLLHLILTAGNSTDRLKCVKLLIDAGCDPRARNAAGKTALHVAATNGFVAVLEHFLSLDLTLPNDIFLSSTQTIDFLIQKGIDLRSVATNYGDARTVILRSYDDENCLQRMKILIGLGWDLSAKDSAGDTAIHVIARSEFLSSLQYLLSQSVALPADILLAAVPSDEEPCTRHTVSLVHVLIRQGVNLNVTSSDGDTPLHLTLKSKITLPDEYPHLDHRNDLCKLIEILLNHGSDPHARNAAGQTPFDLAEAKGPFFKENFLRLVRNSCVQRLCS